MTPPRSPRRLLAVIVLAAGATPALAAIDVTGTLAFGDPLILGARQIRNSAPSACGAAKPFPGTVAIPSTTGLRYDEFAYTHTGPAQCVTFRVTGNCAEPGVLLSAYTGALDPEDVSAGYLGDSGESSNNNIVQTLALDMTSGQSIRLVVSNGSASDDAPQTCAWRVTSSEPAAVSAVPTLGEAGLLLTGLLAAGLGARRLRRRR